MEPNNEQAWYWAGESESRSLAPWEERKRTQRHQRQKDEKPRAQLPYEIILHNTPISLDEIEYRIVSFLASKPYYAFSSQQITDYVNEQKALIEPTELPRSIIGLRLKLGFFRDFVQSVPHIGYRFKP